MRKRTIELIGDVTILQTFTGEIKNALNFVHATNLIMANIFFQSNQNFYIGSNKSIRKC